MPSWINGKAGELLSILDRGLQYGDGIFETIAVKAGKAQYLGEHLQRLDSGCRQLGFPTLDTSALRCEIDIALTGQPTCVLKIIVTRGTGGRGYRPPKEVASIRILQVLPSPEYPPDFWAQGVALRLCEIRLGKNPRLAGIKTLNRLEQVLARMEWSEGDIFEGVMCDSDGMVVEATQSNIFWIRENILFTPDLSFCGVAGIMRQQVLLHAEMIGMDTQIVREPVSTLRDADEVFISSSLIGVMPVNRIETRQYSVGRYTNKLQQDIEKN